MKKINLLFLLPLAALIYSCEPEFKDEVVFEPGKADFRNYVAVGNSLTAGFQSSALSREGQLNSYPAIMAEQFAKVESGMASFKQPLLSEGPGIGPALNAELVLGYTLNCKGETSLGPVPSAPSGQLADFQQANWIGAQGPYYNFGVPGAKIGDVVDAGYMNPFWLRFKDHANPQSILNTALESNPTFYSLWIGNNDVLGYAISGGSSGSITPVGQFTADLNAITNAFANQQAQGVIANIPDITSLPFFTTVPWNGLALSEAQATGLNAAASVYNGALDQAVAGSQLSAEEAEMRKLRFGAGANAFVIVDNDLTDLSAGGIPNMRQIKSTELIGLSVEMDSILCKGYGSFNATASEFRPLTENNVLDENEIQQIKDAVSGYNQAIKNVADQKGLAFVNTNAIMKEFQTGLSYDGVNYSTEFVTGGLFSLDGVHPNTRGYAIIANAHIDAINNKFSANVPKVNVNDYPGVTFP